MLQAARDRKGCRGPPRRPSCPRGPPAGCALPRPESGIFTYLDAHSRSTPVPGSTGRQVPSTAGLGAQAGRDIAAQAPPRSLLDESAAFQAAAPIGRWLALRGRRAPTPGASNGCRPRTAPTPAAHPAQPRPPALPPRHAPRRHGTPPAACGAAGPRPGSWPAVCSAAKLQSGKPAPRPQAPGPPRSAAPRPRSTAPVPSAAQGRGVAPGVR